MLSLIIITVWLYSCTKLQVTQLIFFLQKKKPFINLKYLFLWFPDKDFTQQSRFRQLSRASPSLRQLILEPLPSHQRHRAPTSLRQFLLVEALPSHLPRIPENVPQRRRIAAQRHLRSNGQQTPKQSRLSSQVCHAREKPRACRWQLYQRLSSTQVDFCRGERYRQRDLWRASQVQGFPEGGDS